MGKRLKVEDYIGKKFGRLTVVEEVKTEDSFTTCLCKCDCSNTVVKRLTDIKRGEVRSCGCLLKEAEIAVGKLTKHGKRYTRLYRSWNHMKDRCLNPNCDAYSNYGGRGITICREWVDSFENFYEWAISNGGYREGLTIERLDVNGNYEPSNCTFVDRHTQARNKRNTRTVTIDGETKIWADWVRHFNIADSTVRNRVNKGMSVEEAFKTPIKKG